MDDQENVLVESPCEIVETLSINPFVAKVKIKVCYVSDEPNRNHSIINKETGMQLAKSLPGCPIVGHYIPEKGDFGAHDKAYNMNGSDLEEIDITRPYGFIDIHPRVWFQSLKDQNGVEHEYLLTEGYIWTGYDEAKRVVEKGNNQSMKLCNDDEWIDGEWIFNEKDLEFYFVINKAILENLCILGEDEEPCFEGASIKTPSKFSLEDGGEFKMQFLDLMSKIQYSLEQIQEGGSKLGDNMQEPAAVEETVVAPTPEQTPTPEPAVELTPVSVQDPESEVTMPEMNTPRTGVDGMTQEQTQTPAMARLDAIGESVTEIAARLSVENSDLRNTIEKLEKENKALKQENSDLSEFRKKAERKDKQDMINSFFMLSDDEKLDVITHMDEYSLSDIEIKLSVLDSRKNRANYGKETPVDNEISHETQEVYNYSLSNGGMNGDNVPDWVRAAREVAKEID